MRHRGCDATEMRPATGKSRPLSSEDAAFAEDPVKEAAGNIAPSVGLPPPINHQINCHAESPQLLAEPSVLLSAPVEVGLDDEQVQIAIGSRLASSPRAEENDIRIRNGRT